jgi:hypothetical protein
MGDSLDDQEFYELMQTYRLSSVADQHRTSLAFEAVKDYVRKHFTEKHEDGQS